MNNEDIKVLEEYVEEFNENKKKYKMVYSTGFGKYWTDFVQAIENLIKGYKDLEEYKKYAELTKISCCTAQNCGALNNAIREGIENQKLREHIKDLEKEKLSKSGIYKIGVDFDNDYIPKSKVREKIEELEKEIENINNKNDGYWEFTSIILDEQKQVLEELLQEGDDK